MKVAIYIAILFSLVSCFPDPIPISVNQAPTKLVVSSQYIPGVGISVLITKSFSALENRSITDSENASSLVVLQDLLVSNAEVHIKYLDQSKSLNELSAGVYMIDLETLPENTELKIEVYDPKTGLSVNASTLVKQQVMLGNIEYQVMKQNEERNLLIDFSIIDPPGDNWYVLNFYSQLGDEGGFNGFTEFEFLNSHSVLINNNDVYHGEVTLRNWTKDTLAVALSNISMEHYHYLDQLKKSAQSVPFVTEPANVLGNVIGGYGFFSAQYPDLRTIILEE